MTTLDDLLLLLPDNTVGAIDAADLRTVVTAIWEAGAAVEARTSALELDANGGSVISVTGIWTANPTPGGVPSLQNSRYEVTCDTGDFDTAAWLRFRPMDKDKRDLTNAIVAATTIFAQQKTDSTNWVRYSVDSVTVETSYIEVAVTVLGDSGGEAGAAAWAEAIVVFGGITAGSVGA